MQICNTYAKVLENAAKWDCAGQAVLEIVLAEPYLTKYHIIVVLGGHDNFPATWFKKT